MEEISEAPILNRGNSPVHFCKKRNKIVGIVGEKVILMGGLGPDY
jgi:hypothetical protein